MSARKVASAVCLGVAHSLPAVFPALLGVALVVGTWFSAVNPVVVVGYAFEAYAALIVARGVAVACRAERARTLMNRVLLVLPVAGVPVVAFSTVGWEGGVVVAAVIACAFVLHRIARTLRETMRPLPLPVSAVDIAPARERPPVATLYTYRA